MALWPLGASFSRRRPIHQFHLHFIEPIYITLDLASFPLQRSCSSRLEGVRVAYLGCPTCQVFASLHLPHLELQC